MDDNELDSAMRFARDTGNREMLRKLERQKAALQKKKERLKRDVLKQQLQKREKKDDRKTNMTLTREQVEKSTILTAHDTLTPEQQILDAKRRDDEQAASQEYQGDVG